MSEPSDEELIDLARAVVYAEEQGADEDLPEAMAALRAVLEDREPPHRGHPHPGCRLCGAIYPPDPTP